MPSISDLNQSDLDQFLPIENTVRDRKGFCSPFERSALVSLFRKHGAIKTAFVIHHCMGNEWLKSPRWEALMDVVEKHGMDKVLFAIKSLNKLENHSIDMVENICLKPSLAKRKPAGASNEPVRPLPERPYPPTDHRYSQAQASRWLMENDKSGSNPIEFFENGGRDANNIQLYLLKSEYR